MQNQIFIFYVNLQNFGVGREYQVYDEMYTDCAQRNNMDNNERAITKFQRERNDTDRRNFRPDGDAFRTTILAPPLAVNIVQFGLVFLVCGLRCCSGLLLGCLFPGCLPSCVGPFFCRLAS